MIPAIRTEFYPNPFSGSVTISVEARRTEKITMKIFDHTGRLTDVLYDDVANGPLRFVWTPSDDGGGIYFLKIEGDGFSETRKMVMLD